jgi:hypothetical protein
MTPRGLSSRLLPLTPTDPGHYEGAFDDLDAATRALNVVMGPALLLDVMDKAKGSVVIHHAIKGEMERLREAIGEFSDARSDEAGQAAARKKISKHAKKLAVAILHKPGMTLKGEAGAALDAAVLSALLTLVDAGLHVPPWDAPKAAIVERAKANRLVVEKMARLMADANDQS